MRNRTLLAGAIAATLATGAWGGARAMLGVPSGDPELIEQLSGIDYVPSRGTLDEVVGDSAATSLIQIVRDLPAGQDPGVRIRAFRALALYPGPETSDALRDGIAVHGSAGEGVQTLYLRAAMDALARVDGAAAVPPLAPFLNHSSRDVRAAAAAALAATGSDDAVPALRARLPNENELQVLLAIAEALRSLAHAD